MPGSSVKTAKANSYFKCAIHTHSTDSTEHQAPAGSQAHYSYLQGLLAALLKAWILFKLPKYAKTWQMEDIFHSPSDWQKKLT